MLTSLSSLLSGASDSGLTYGSKSSTLTWDEGDRLSKAVLGSIMFLPSAGYLDDGRRAWRENPDGSYAFYLYDDSGAYGTVPVGEYNADGVETALNIVGPDGWRERVIPDWDDNYNYGTGSNTATDDSFAFDPQGTVTERLRIDLSSYSSNETAAYLYDESAYDSWGNRLLDYDPYGTAHSFPDPEQITPTDAAGYEAQFGYQTDTATGLVLAGHRYYQPQTRRWVNRDPIGYAGGINLYEYSGNDPVNEADHNDTDFGDYANGIGDALNPVKAAKGIYELGKYLVSGHANLRALGSSGLTSLNPIDPNATDREGGARVTGDLFILAGGYGLLTQLGTLGAIGDAAADIGEATSESGLEGGADAAKTATNCFVAGTLAQMADGAAQYAICLRSFAINKCHSISASSCCRYNLFKPMAGRRMKIGKSSLHLFIRSRTFLNLNVLRANRRVRFGVYQCQLHRAA